MTKKELIDAMADMPDDAWIWINCLELSNKKYLTGATPVSVHFTKELNQIQLNDQAYEEFQTNARPNFKHQLTMTDKGLQPIAWTDLDGNLYAEPETPVIDIDNEDISGYVPLYTLDQAREIIDRENESKTNDNA